MYASVTTGQVQAGKLTDFITLWNDSIKPFVQTFPGFVDVYVLTDQTTNAVITVALYETETAATATQTSGKFQEIVGIVAHLLILETVVRKGYEVSIHT